MKIGKIAVWAGAQDGDVNVVCSDNGNCWAEPRKAAPEPEPKPLPENPVVVCDDDANCTLEEW